MKRLIFALIVALLLPSAVAAPPADGPTGPIKVFTPVSYNEARADNGDGTLTSNFASGWVNYTTGTGSWANIDLNFIQTGTGYFLNNAPYHFAAPLLANGSFRFVSVNPFNTANKSYRADAPIGKTKKFMRASAVTATLSGTDLVYAGAFPLLNADLVIRPRQDFVQYLIKFNSAPSGTGPIGIPFQQVMDAGMSVFNTQMQSLSLAGNTDVGSGVALAVNSFRGVFTSPAYIWDSSTVMNIQRISVIEKKINTTTLSGAKILPRAFFSTATYPVFSDTTDNFTSNDGGDGFIEGHDTTFAGALTTNLSVIGTFQWGSQFRTVDNHYYRWHSYVPFDTSSIADNATVSAVTMTITGTSKQDDKSVSPVVGIYSDTQASNTALATGDMSNIGSSSPYATITYASFNAAGTNDFVMNASGIAQVSLTSFTKYGMRTDREAAGTAPSNASASHEYFAGNDASQPTGKPNLAVTYSVPVTVKAPLNTTLF